jgi:hypothetical protein
VNFLENVLGGKQQKRQQYQDFIGRYEQGPPWQGIDDDEAVERYQEVEQHVPHDVYEDSAHEAFARMSPQERRQFGQYMRQQARQQNFNFPDFDQDGIDDRFEQDPRMMAQTMGRMHRQHPGMFGQLATGGRRRPQQRRRQQKQKSPLDNPLAKAALAGIAAIAVKKMM